MGWWQLEGLLLNCDFRYDRYTTTTKSAKVDMSPLIMPVYTQATVYIPSTHVLYRQAGKTAQEQTTSQVYKLP